MHNYNSEFISSDLFCCSLYTLFCLDKLINWMIEQYITWQTRIVAHIIIFIDNRLGLAKPTGCSLAW